MSVVEEGSGLGLAMVPPLDAGGGPLELRLDLGPRSAGGFGAGPAVLEIAPVAGEAALILMGSYLRSVQGFAEAAVRLQPVMAAALTAGLGGAGRAAGLDLVEQMRAALREIGDATLREARRVELELAGVGERLAMLAAPVDADAPYRRRWATKP